MQIRRRLFFFLGCFIAFVTHLEANAYQAGRTNSPQILSEITKAEMAEVLSSFGWEVIDLPTALEIKVNDITGFITLKDCTEGTPERCKTLIFYANFDLGREILAKDSEVVNTYNDTKILGRAYFLEFSEPDSDQVGVDFRISLKGGVTREHLVQESLNWGTILNNFVEFFREKMAE